MAIWDKINSRGRVEDRRGSSSIGIASGGIGLTTIAIVLLVNILGGGDVEDVLTQLQDVQIQSTQNYNTQDFEGEDSYEIFASKVVGSANDNWANVFTQNGLTYNEPRLVLFRGATQSACGGADTRVGPHYCPLDQTIYLDETFFDELKNRFGAEGGDVAEAYVIAHEVGHHIQQELNILGGERVSNEESIEIELQADCFAGLWAHSIKDLNVFEPGEIQEALDAAAAVGDDRIQSKATGMISPESWTHGSSSQRMTAFNRGFETGSTQACGL